MDAISVTMLGRRCREWRRWSVAALAMTLAVPTFAFVVYRRPPVDVSEPAARSVASVGTSRAETIGYVPLVFVPNTGQSDRAVRRCLWRIGESPKLA